MEKFKVTFYPDKKSVEVEKGKTILAASISAGVPINSVCGGDGVCGRCKIILKKGKVFSQATGMLSAEEKKRGIHLACLAVVESDLEVEVPAESRQSFTVVKEFYSKPEEIEGVKADIPQKPFEYAPLTTKFYLELPVPNLDDKVSDLERLCRKIKQIQNIPVNQTSLANIRGLGELLRDADWKVTVTLGERNNLTEIIAIEPQDTAQKNFGVAIDIGTTTLSAQLVDLNKHLVLGSKATYNQQASFGSDVITRIIYAKEEDGLENLHAAVTQGINQMIQELAGEHNVDLNDVTCAVCAGNTTMIHLLLRIDPSYIRKEPYVPTTNFVPVIHASEAGIKINPRGLLFCAPGVASYVGGDTTAGVLSCGLYKQDDLAVLIDIGTNGEIVLGNKDFLVACAASAGPAFEGSGVTCGMRSSRGAIQKAKISSDLGVIYNTIGETKPRGICGSGYIDLIAEMLRSGIIDKDGKIKIEGPRIRQGETGNEFVVVSKEDTESGSDIVISEADIENLKRAKAAIFSASAILLKHMSLDFSQVKKIFIAGGFGTYLDIDNAIRIGLLPDLERSKFLFIGNSALAGARQILLSSQASSLADEIARKMTYFELSVEPAYMDEYMAALFFPHTDLSKFPSMTK